MQAQEYIFDPKAYAKRKTGEINTEIEKRIQKTIDVTGFSRKQVMKYLKEYTHKEIQAGLKTLYYVDKI